LSWLSRTRNLSGIGLKRDGSQGFADISGATLVDEDSYQSWLDQASMET